MFFRIIFEQYITFKKLLQTLIIRLIIGSITNFITNPKLVCKFKSRRHIQLMRICKLVSDL